MTWKVQPLFATPLAQSSINPEVCDILTDMLEDYDFAEDDDGLSAVSVNKHVMHDNVNKVAITTSKHVLHNKSAVLDYFTRKVRQCICELGYLCDVQITTSWFTATLSGGSAQEHAHCNSWFSGVVYFDEYDPDSSPIQFVNPPSGVYVSPSTDNEYNATDHVIVPSKGTILLFPSGIRHRVLKNYSQYERYSLAFNVLPKGHVDVGDSSYTYQ